MAEGFRGASLLLLGLTLSAQAGDTGTVVPWEAEEADALDVSDPPTPELPVEASAPARLPGMVLPVAPSVAPGRVAPDDPDPLAIARVRWNQGDAAGTVSALSPWLESRQAPYGRARVAGHLLLGLATMELGSWNVASANFYRVRRTGGPLAPYGAWYEALVDHERGRHYVAVKECKAYRESWPDGPQADECLLLIGDAYAAAGNRGAALGSYQAYLERHPDTPREEEIRLAIAQATALSNPKAGIRLLQQLAISYTYPSTALAAEQGLAELAALGHDTTLPDDLDTRMRQADSLRRAGRFDEAWDSFNALADLAPDNPGVAAWVDRNEERFAAGTRRYDVLARSLREQYEADASPELAWRIFGAWRREGRYDKALEWGRKGLEEHGSHYRWRSALDDVAWAALHGGDYPDAAARFGELKARGGEPGRKYAFYEAYSLHRAGRAEEAIAAFDSVIANRRGWAAAGHYWRGKARAAQGEAEAAAADLAQAIELDDSGWYHLVSRARDVEVDPAWRIRDGRWHGDVDAVLPAWSAPVARASTSDRRFTASQPVIDQPGGSQAGFEVPERTADWSRLAWGRVSAGGSGGGGGEALVPEAEADGFTIDVDLPSGYQACAFFDPVEADKAFYRFTEQHKGLWPDLPAAYDLASAGLYTEAGLELAGVYREWDAARDAGVPTPRQQSLRALRIGMAEWRQYFLVVQDANLSSRFCYGLWKHADTAEDRTAALRLAYPIVRGREVWDHGRHFDVDPYLMLAIMRQESRYRADALSHVGAIGLVQVMPRTGARVAAMLGEHRYSPGALQDPAVNLRYGTFYLSRLLDRFDGVFPLAVGSYNGGPHNMSRWYRSYHDKGIDLDALVEQIEYDETRDYVKKVSGYYARYVELYEPPGSRVVVPVRARGDDDQVIDF